MSVENLLSEILTELRIISKKLDSNNKDVSSGGQQPTRSIREEVAERIAAARREIEQMKGK